MINGFVVIDKPAGITSHDVVSRVRRILGTRRVGHTGTLDPFATGVLPIAVNDGTKAIPFLDEGIKCYEAVVRLGVATDTLDMTGTILHESDCSQLTQSQFETVMKSFTGVLQQIPPMYSAIKRDGQPLYKLARQGVEIERPAREVTVSRLELLSYRLPLVEIRVTCSRGTYVRSLADDMGRALGCGAALQELRRTASGAFALDAALTLEALESAVSQGTVEDLVVSPRAALPQLPEIAVSGINLEHIAHGRSPILEHDSLVGVTEAAQHDLVRLTHDNRLVAVGQVEYSSGQVSRIKLKRVFM